MKLEGNTIFVTGGTQGIGRGLAERFHARGNKVIIAGRNTAKLNEVVSANRGMSALELDISSPASITEATAKLLKDHPEVNVLFNNAGIMLIDDAASIVDERLLTSQLAVNLMGPVRMTSALIGHLKSQPNPAVIYTTSLVPYGPIAFTAIYSATKAALHSYVLSQRFLLKPQGVEVIEVLPPWTRTDLLNSSKEEGAMPLADFLTETMEQFETGADEILVARAKAIRDAAIKDERDYVNGLNAQLLAKFRA